MLVPAPGLPGLRSLPLRLGVAARAVAYGVALPSKAGDGACHPFCPAALGTNFPLDFAADVLP